MPVYLIGQSSDKRRGAVKLHLLLDHEGYLPVFAHITEGKVHEVNIARGLSFPGGSIVVMDRGYIDQPMHYSESGQKREYIL
ncbi:MAG: transposase [Nitrospirota bacterium]|nr:transposase [Nitrospirota bacterium]